MPHKPQPLPTGNKFKDKRALKNYNKEHKRQSEYNKRNVETAREIAHKGTYTSKRNLIPGFGGIKIMNSETTEQIPFQGPYSIAQTEINNLAWVIENKNISDQERSMLESAKLQLQNRMELGITQDQTWNNQIARNNMNAKTFFETGTSDKEPDLSNYENFAEYRRGANQNLTEKVAEVKEEKPTVKEEKPTVKEEKPKVKKEQPTVKEEKPTVKKEQKVQVDKGSEVKKDKGSEVKKDKLEQQASARQKRLDRRDARLEAKKLEGFPAKRFKGNLKKGTPISELFHKDRKR
jgi:hypothetical protein